MTDGNAFTVRRGVPTDAAALAILAARTFEQTFGPDNDPSHIAAHLGLHYGVTQQAAELADPGVVTLVVERDGALVAYAQVRRHPPPPCVTHALPVELRRFYVDRPAHGSGLAQALMASVRHAAHELGGAHLWLSVWERNPRAIAFYARQGFVDVGGIDFFVGTDRQNDRVMVAPVATA